MLTMSACTSKKRREKIEISKFERARWKSQKRTGDALPGQVQAVIETGQALVKEAKGLGEGGDRRQRAAPNRGVNCRG